jgi:hypothetical protein
MAKWVIAACVLLAGWLYHTWMHSLDAFYRQQIPVEVEVADLLYFDSGIRGSCGAAIFELSPRSKAQLSRSGVRALTGTIRGQVAEARPGISEDWKETPYIYHANESPGESYWALTLGCTWLGKVRWDTILGALGKPGSYFRRHKEGVILVIPSADIVAYLFFD